MTDTSATFATCIDCWETNSLSTIKKIYKENYHLYDREYTLSHCLEQVEKEYHKTRNDPGFIMKNRNKLIKNILKNGI
jgi:hypothetical protein